MNKNAPGFQTGAFLVSKNKCNPQANEKCNVGVTSHHLRKAHTMLISVRMALDSLTEQCTVVSDTQDVLTRERGIRDNLIRGMFGARVPAKELVKITGLSRDRLYTISTSPHFEE